MTDQKPPRKTRKTFATETFKKITCRCQYYRRILSEPIPEHITDPKERKRLEKQRAKIQAKYARDTKVRKLLHRAINHLYE